VSRGEAEEKDVLFSQLLRLAHDAPRSIRRVDFEHEQRVAVATLTDGSRLRADYPRDESQVELEELLSRAGVPFEPLDG
jgi:hypothetical protein